MRISDWSSDVCSSDLDEVCGGFLSINPVRPGHVLLVPRVAVDHWIDLEPPIVAHLGRIAQMVGQSLREIFRSEERRVGKECVSTCRSRWSPSHYKKKKYTQKRIASK